MYTLETPIGEIKGIGPKTLKVLIEHQIFDVKDLLLNLPRGYEDRCEQHNIQDAKINQINTFTGTFSNKKKYYKNKRLIVTAIFHDHSGSIKTIWFNNKYIYQSLKEDLVYRVSAKINNNTLIQPIIEPQNKQNIHTGRIVPLYTAKTNISPSSMRKIMHQLIYSLKIKEPPFVETINLPSLEQSFAYLHFPEDEEKTKQGWQRLCLEEILELLHHSQQIKANAKIKKNYFKVSNPKLVAKYQKLLPFELTLDQHKAIKQIQEDLNRSTSMNRLLIADTGAGKTVVATLASLPLLEKGHHTCLIAPTKILAQQHQKTLAKLFTHHKFILFDSLSSIIEQPSFIIGTHKLLNHLEKIKPGLVIYDEQHKFGTTQRSIGYDLKKTPHTLAMTATSIPRTLALTLFSHLDLSYIETMPEGKQKTKTFIVPKSKEENSREWILEKITNNNWQALIVCPFINPSQTPSHAHIQNVTTTFLEWEKFLKQKNSNLQIATLHSEMSKDDQEAIIKKLYQKQINILISTPMIEVGVDLPDANIIAIYSAQQFGLASLHQLRGRVGRNKTQAYCLVYADSATNKVRSRLEYFVKENKGHLLAQFDLENRGAGDLFGTQQHGFLGLKFGSWSNLKLIETAKQQYHLLKGKYQPLLNLTANNNIADTN